MSHVTHNNTYGPGIPWFIRGSVNFAPFLTGYTPPLQSPAKSGRQVEDDKVDDDVNMTHAGPFSSERFSGGGKCTSGCFSRR